MKKVFIIILVMLLLLAFSVTAAIGKNKVGELGMVDVVVLMDGDTSPLIDFIQSMGGTISIQYKNVPAVAASVPLSQKSDLLSFPGVLRVEKDLQFSIEDEKGEKPRFYEVEDAVGIEFKSIDLASVDFDAMPEGYANFIYTGAIDAWTETLAGEGSVVAVVDTGTTPNFCLTDAVIGAPGFPEGYNASGDGYPATYVGNHWHGTHVAGVIASNCFLDFSANPANPIYQAQLPYLGWPEYFVPILGQAPMASIYPVKVGDTSGGLQTSWIFDGLDHLISLKLSGDLDIDIVNMSLGGGTQYDGRDIFDRFVEAVQDAGMLLVTSASNDGPIPNSIGSPATSFAALSVGALDYPENSRVLYEYLGLAVWPGAPGMGMVMRPNDDVMVADFSSRGPISDGRMGPEIQALGSWNFAQNQASTGVRWAGGTSFSSPTVAGGAALLNAYWENEFGGDIDPVVLETVLLKGANPEVVGPAWRDVNDQGHGTLDIPASLGILKAGNFVMPQNEKVGELKANILGQPKNGKTESWESGEFTLGPGETVDFVFEINSFTSKVYIEIFDIETDDNVAYAYWPNALTIHVQNAKRTSVDRPIQDYWYPYSYADGDTAMVEIEDGWWSFNGGPFDPYYSPMEPGLMKLTLMPDVTNEAPVSFKVKVVRENYKEQTGVRIDNKVIKTTDSNLIPVEIPEGVSVATFDLVWHRDWSKFPTTDLDLIIIDPTISTLYADGATWNAPERQVIHDPMAGTWYLFVDGYELYGVPDNYDLFLTLEYAD